MLSAAAPHLHYLCVEAHVDHRRAVGLRRRRLDDENDAKDQNGHGTHVASVIVASAKLKAKKDGIEPTDPGDDRLASFSSAGPTFEGFVKPDVVAPGGLIGIMEAKSGIAKQHPRFASPYKQLFTMSGTSQATAIVSGMAVLMLQANPGLSPDDVKCALMATARPAERPDGGAAYSVFQQGAGLVNAYDAVFGGQAGCANNGLDVTKDLDGIEHYGGPAMQDGNDVFYLLDESGDGTTWEGDYSGSDGYPWANGFPWSNGFPWTNGYAWSNGLAEPASIDVWVPQE